MVHPQSPLHYPRSLPPVLPLHRHKRTSAHQNRRIHDFSSASLQHSPKIIIFPSLPSQKPKHTAKPHHIRICKKEIKNIIFFLAHRLCPFHRGYCLLYRLIRLLLHEIIRRSLCKHLSCATLHRRHLYLHYLHSPRQAQLYRHAKPHRNHQPNQIPPFCAVALPQQISTKRQPPW